MKSRGRFFVWLLFGLFAAGAGYLWWDGAPTDFDGEDQSGDAPIIQGAISPSGPVKAEKLDVSLKAGDSFPLRKTVTETVTQQTIDGPIESKTTLKILLAIHVQDVQPKKTRLRVEYQHVQYKRTLGSEKIEYDSSDDPRSVPLEAQPYRGLVNNGFEFWIGPDHKVIELVGFREFLVRCVQHVPQTQREEVMRQFVVNPGEERIANFIDDSFGLLPKQGTTVKPGASWIKTRKVARPVELNLTSKCTLTDLDDRVAKIDIHGTVTPAAPVGKATSAGRALQLTITGGSITGHCRIRRSSGLPEHSDITRLLEMNVRLPDGRVVKQTKRTSTVIAVYSQQGNPKSIAMPKTASTGTADNEPRRITRLSKD